MIPYEDWIQVDTVRAAEVTLRLDRIVSKQTCKGTRFSGPILNLNVPAETQAEILISRNNVDVPQLTLESYFDDKLEEMTVHESEFEVIVEVPVSTPRVAN